VVKAQVEGLSFSVSTSADTKGCHLCIVDYINRNTLFSSKYMLQMFVLFSMGKFVVHVDGIC
jgi:hypothetical protein